MNRSPTRHGLCCLHCQVLSRVAECATGRKHVVDPQLVQMGQRLRDEEKESIDYAQAVSKAGELGIQVTQRTIRFYVNEGILPAPQKRGKTPVFPERQILNQLLSIHLMKTRFNRSLAEIKEIMQFQAEDSVILADKCTLLYEEYSRAEGLSRVQKDWMVDAFFRSLTGRLSLYPRSRRNEPGPRRAGDVLVTEIVEDVDKEGRWETPPGSETRWLSPEATLGVQESEGACDMGDLADEAASTRGLRRFRHPEQVRGRLRFGLPRVLSQSAVHRRAHRAGFCDYLSEPSSIR